MSHNTWAHRLIRPLVKPLASSPITPNHLTAARLITGILAASCFAADDPVWNITGAVIFMVSMMLDRADGELARLQGSGSRFGALFDIVTDAVCDTVVVLALGAAALNGPLGAWALVLAVFAGLSVSAIFIMLLFMETHYGQGSTGFRGYTGFDPDDAMIAIPIAVLLGLGDHLVVIAAICAPAAAIYIYRDMNHRRQSIEQ